MEGSVRNVATEWVLLPVPREDYAELKHMVEYRQQQRGKAASPSSEELRGDEIAVDTVLRAAFGEHKAWPPSALARLAEGSTLTTHRWARVMDLCAEEPGATFSTEEVSTKTGIPVNEWRDACRKIGAHLKKHYPDVPLWERDPHIGEPMWPLVAISGRHLKVRDQLYVGITEEQAERWKEVR